jgi:hypothetical protein
MHRGDLFNYCADNEGDAVRWYFTMLVTVLPVMTVCLPPGCIFHVFTTTQVTLAGLLDPSSGTSGANSSQVLLPTTAPSGSSGAAQQATTNNEGLSPGAITGIVIGSLAAGALVAAGLVMGVPRMVRHYRRERKGYTLEELEGGGHGVGGAATAATAGNIGCGGSGGGVGGGGGKGVRWGLGSEGGSGGKADVRSPPSVGGGGRGAPVGGSIEMHLNTSQHML